MRTAIGSVLALVTIGSTMACSGEPACLAGPGTAGTTGVTASAESVEITYGDFAAAANNDCPADGTPEGVISMTVAGSQTSPAGAAVITLCLPRPDLIEPGSTFDLNADNHPALADDRVHVIDVQADLEADCRWAHDPADAPTGTATFDGFCDEGIAPEGFALTFDGTVTVTETCPATPDRELTVTLAGTVAVRAGEL